MHLISKKVDYALRALTFLAQTGNGHATLAREISKRQKIPMRFLQKIMKELVDGQLARSFHGPGGGYALAKDPSGITVKEVVEAVEGPIDFIDCVDGDPGCGLYDRCPQVDIWRTLHGQFVGLLDQRTLKELSSTEKKN